MGRHRVLLRTDRPGEVAQVVIGPAKGQPRLAVVLALEQPFEPPVEVAGPAQEPSAERAELLLLQEQVLAHAGVIGPDRLLGQREPGPLPIVGRLQIGVGLDLAPVGFPEARVGELQRVVGPGLDHQHDDQADRDRQRRHRGRRDRRAVAPHPSPGPPRPGLAPGGDRLVGRPSIHVVGQRPGRRIAVLRPQRHRLQADRLQRRVDRGVELPRRREVALADGADRAQVVCLDRRLAREQAIERRAQAIHVGPRADPLEVAGRLLGAHVGGRPQRRAGERLGRAAGRRRSQGALVRRQARLRPARRLGQAPVDDQRLAILADDDVGRLDVAVDHAAGVGVLDGVADVDEPPQERPQGERRRPGSSFIIGSAWKAAMASLRVSPRMNRMA